MSPMLAVARWLVAAASLTLAVALAACGVFGPRTVEVPQARLQEIVARRFPVEKRLFDWVAIRIDSPRLSLQPDANRIAVEVAVTAAGDALVTPPLVGTLAASAGLRFDAGDNTVRLVDARVERFVIEGLPTAWQRQLDRLGRPLAKNLLEGEVLYALRPKDVAGLEGRGVRPGDLRVTETGIAIMMLPVER